MNQIINFIKYHNLFTIILGLVFIVSASAMANEDVRNAVIGEEIVTEQGIDNSQLLAADLDNFDMALKIQNVREDDENYYIDYTFNTIAIKDNVWQPVIREKRATISKKALGDRDLGLYLQEELSEVADHELAYLKEVQTNEKEKGLTKLVATVEYTGLIGLVLDVKEKVLPGYEPVIPEPEPEICDGIDNDRDGLIDEDLGQTTCGTGACQVTVDNCLNGSLIACVPATPGEEICDDGIDNDCDGIVDNPEICQPKPAVEEEPICQPTTEICDGLDNDCDGLIDENLTRQCGTSDVGACQFGIQTCSSGVWGECLGTIEPAVEICDGIDNNCNNEIDEGGVCEIAEPPAEDVCDATHLTLCMTQAECETAAGFWYNDQCNTEAEAPPQDVCDVSHLNLCLTETDCTNAEGFWYNEGCNTEPEAPACAPDWSCTEWEQAPSSIGCGESFIQTRTCTDLNNCGTDEGKPAEEQQAAGTDATACGITSCNPSLNLAGECQNTCLEGDCQTCTPTCTCAESFSDCDGDMSNGCETASSTCPTVEPLVE